MTAHRLVPVSKSLEAPPGRMWWRCLDCGGRWPFHPVEDDPCEGPPDAAA